MVLEEAGRHFLRQKLFSLHIQVSVNVRGHLNIGVFLHIFQRKTVVQEQAGAAVPKLTETDMRQVVVLQEKREMGRNVIQRKGSAVRPFEDKVVFLVVGTAELSVDRFFGSGLDKDYCAIIGLNQKDLENQGILA